jgi:hypothetical protein
MKYFLKGQFNRRELRPVNGTRALNRVAIIKWSATSGLQISTPKQRTAHAGLASGIGKPILAAPVRARRTVPAPLAKHAALFQRRDEHLIVPCDPMYFNLKPTTQF